MSEFLPLRITRSSAAGQVVTAPWLRLEQITPPETTQYASLADMYRSWMYAASGIPVRQIRPAGCPVEFDGSIVRFFLGFYAWPSDLDLRYTLVSNIGELGPPQHVAVAREFNLFANNAVGMPLPYYMDPVSVIWESPVYNRYGEQIVPPAVENRHTHLLFSAEAFGAMRITGTAHGTYHVLTVEVDKAAEDVPVVEPERPTDDETYYLNELPPADNANKIENIEPTVAAYWDGGSTEIEVEQDQAAPPEQLRLEVPQCVRDVLTACPGSGPDGSSYVLQWCEKTSDRQVYYSTCDGSILKVRDGVNPHRYCSQLAKGPGPGPTANQWLWGGR